MLKNICFQFQNILACLGCFQIQHQSTPDFPGWVPSRQWWKRQNPDTFVLTKNLTLNQISIVNNPIWHSTNQFIDHISNLGLPRLYDSKHFTEECANQKRVSLVLIYIAYSKKGVKAIMSNNQRTERMTFYEKKISKSEEISQ